MKHTRLFAAIAIAIAIAAIAMNATAGIYYVATNGTANGDGSLANPLDLATAYALASSNSVEAVVQMMPGVYSGTNMHLGNSKVIIKGSGSEQTILDDSIGIVVEHDSSMAELQAEGAVVLTNGACLFVSNVRFLDGDYPMGTGTVVGVWYKGTGIRVRGLTAPEQPTDAVPRSYIDAVTGNLTAASITAGTLAEQRIDGAIARDSEVAAATNGLAYTFVLKNGDTMGGGLSVPALAVTSTNDWLVGSANAPDASVKLVGSGSKITTEGTRNLVLDSGGGTIVMQKKVQIKSPWAGTVYVPASAYVAVTGMSANAIVILTPQGTSAGTCRYAVDQQQDGFTVYSSDTVTYNYLVIER